MKFLIIFPLLFSYSLHGQSAKEIINQYLDTVSNGDIDNWNKIRSVYAENEVFYSQGNFDQAVSFSPSEKASFHKHFTLPPYGQRIELYGDSAFTDLQSTFYFLKNKHVYLLKNMAPLIKKNPRKPSEFLSIHKPVFIRNIVKNSTEAELLGIKEFPLDGVWCYEIKVTTKGRVYYFYINTETYLLDFWNVSPEHDRSFLTKFYNYKKIGDFLIPMSTSALRDGVVFHWSNTRKIELNAEIDPALFHYNPEQK